MIVLNLELDNLFGFEDFKINFSYPKKVENSSIKDEFLKDRPNFRYKKVNILLGANSTGKTSIGKAMMAIFNFLNKKEIITVTQYIRDIEKTMRFSMDFILDGKNDLYRVDFKYKKENESEKIDLDLYKADILDENIKIIKNSNNVRDIICIPQIKNLEDELIYSTNITKIIDLLESKSKKDFKNDFNNYKNLIKKLEDKEFKISKIWSREAVDIFKKYKNESTKIKKD